MNRSGQWSLGLPKSRLGKAIIFAPMVLSMAVVLTLILVMLAVMLPFEMIGRVVKKLRPGQ